VRLFTCGHNCNNALMNAETVVVLDALAAAPLKQQLRWACVGRCGILVCVMVAPPAVLSSRAAAVLLPYSGHLAGRWRRCAANGGRTLVRSACAHATLLANCLNVAEWCFNQQIMDKPTGTCFGSYVKRRQHGWWVGRVVEQRSVGRHGNGRMALTMDDGGILQDTAPAFTLPPRLPWKLRSACLPLLLTCTYHFTVFVVLYHAVVLPTCTLLQYRYLYATTALYTFNLLVSYVNARTVVLTCTLDASDPAKTFATVWDADVSVMSLVVWLWINS
jgi:hypothetical protein